MNKIIKLVVLFLVLSSCSIFKPNDFGVGKSNTKDEVDITFLQVNDFYEIAPLENGKIGGAARIATVRKKLVAENPNTYTVVSGDFLSPSLLGTLKFEGERIKGKHMVDVLNKVRVDLVTFGNHEFDLDEASLQKRINESGFNWVSSNVFQVVNRAYNPFTKEVNGVKEPIPLSKIVKFKSPAGSEFRVGFVAPCIPANKVNYVYYEDIFTSVKKQLDLLKGKVDFIVSLSHLSKDDDMKMAKDFPEIDLIMGGHEHENMKFNIGKTVLTKADANAKTVYVHKIRYYPGSKKTSIVSTLVKLDESVQFDAEVNDVVQKWKAIEGKLMREMGFDPQEVLLTLSSPYDARETLIRNRPAPFCQMICRAMIKAAPKSDCAIMNSGSVRVDDVLKDKLSQYDILRSLPFGGGISEIDIKGSLLKKVLDAGWNNQGSGGFLQWSGIDPKNGGGWLINNKDLDQNKIYHVVISDFLLTGLESKLEFLKAGNPDISNINQAQADNTNDIRRDIRLVIIDYIKKGGR